MFMMSFGLGVSSEFLLKLCVRRRLRLCQFLLIFFFSQSPRFLPSYVSFHCLLFTRISLVLRLVQGLLPLTVRLGLRGLGQSRFCVSFEVSLFCRLLRTDTGPCLFGQATVHSASSASQIVPYYFALGFRMMLNI